MIPRNAPEGTAWFGGPIEWFKITLTVRGDDLDPDQVTECLGCPPDESQRKGGPMLRADGSVARLAEFGAWKLVFRPEDTDEWDCGEAVMLLVQRVPAGVDAWQRLARRFRVGISAGLVMRSHNKGFRLSPDVMRYLGERGIEAGFDVYHEPSPDVARG